MKLRVSVSQTLPVGAILVAGSSAFPNELLTSEAIINFMRKYSPDVNFDYVAAETAGCKAVLKLGAISELVPGPSNMHMQSGANKYKDVDPRQWPPLFVKQGTILDGNHRYYIAKQDDIKNIWYYDLVSL